MPAELVLKGGTLVTAREQFKADLLIRRGRIACIGECPGVNGKTIDVSGRLVMPGGIDAHVHLAHPIDRLELVTADDFFSGTVAAACGGVTSIIDFALQRKGQSIAEAVASRVSQAQRDAVIDFGLHVILTDVRDDVLAEVPRAIEQGFPSFKIYLTYRDKFVDDGGLLKVLEATAGRGGVVFAHCENDCAVTHLIERALARGEVDPRAHAQSRPPLVEGEAINRAIALAELVGARICIAHVTSIDALDRVAAGRRRGVQVHAETCPQYLVLNDHRYDSHLGFEAAKFVCSPPLRAEAHREALWRGVANGDIQLVSSDHAAFRFADQKQHGRGDFTRIPNGVPGIETRLPLLFSEGVSAGRISVHRFVQLTSTNPAKVFGLYPQKGSLAIGADADLVVIDPERELVLHHSSLHQQVDYSPYDGMRVRGVPVLTISRGEIVAADGEPKSVRGNGRLVRRKLEMSHQEPAGENQP